MRENALAPQRGLLTGWVGALLHGMVSYLRRIQSLTATVGRQSPGGHSRSRGWTFTQWLVDSQSWEDIRCQLTAFNLLDTTRCRPSTRDSLEPFPFFVLLVLTRPTPISSLRKSLCISKSPLLERTPAVPHVHASHVQMSRARRRRTRDSAQQCRNRRHAPLHSRSGVKRGVSTISALVPVVRASHCPSFSIVTSTRPAASARIGQANGASGKCGRELGHHAS